MYIRYTSVDGWLSVGALAGAAVWKEMECVVGNWAFARLLGVRMSPGMLLCTLSGRSASPLLVVVVEGFCFSGGLPWIWVVGLC
jgi:hypothetical protein